jgi:hypothetical protein
VKEITSCADWQTGVGHNGMGATQRHRF